MILDEIEEYISRFLKIKLLENNINNQSDVKPFRDSDVNGYLNLLYFK